MARIAFQRLGHGYPGSTAPALKPMDMAWEDCGAYALLGPSGCGKTTLLNIVSGLLRPREGRLLFDGQDVTDWPTERRNVAQVFQFPVVYDTMTVRENLAFPLRNRSVPAAAARARVEHVAGLLGLTATLDRRARNLGADEKQKISLGRGLVRDDVAAILFDEPLTVIDPHLKWELRSRLKELHRQVPVTMIYVTHDQTEALTFADRVVVMSEGEVVQVGTPEALFDQPAHTFVGHFIGSPGMNFLPCTLRGREAVLPGGAVIGLPRGYPALAGRIELGIRPEFATLGRDGGLPVTVLRIEDLGRRRIARVTLDGVPFAATLPEGMPVPAEPRLLLDPARVHVYADGRLVAALDGGGTAGSGGGSAARDDGSALAGTDGGSVSAVDGSAQAATDGAAATAIGTRAAGGNGGGCALAGTEGRDTAAYGRALAVTGGGATTMTDSLAAAAADGRAAAGADDRAVAGTDGGAAIGTDGRAVARTDGRAAVATGHPAAVLTDGRSTAGHG